MHINQKSSCPFNYAGSKSAYTFLHDIECNVIDLFAGGGGFYSNVASGKVFVNDMNEHIISFQKMLYEMNDAQYAMLKKDIYSRTSAITSREAYEAMRSEFNHGKSPVLFYCCLCCCTNNLIRFNKKGGFNQTWGQRMFNSSMEYKLDSFRNRIRGKNIMFNTGSYQDIPQYENALYFVDPPYLITAAGYSTDWSESDDRSLYAYLYNKRFAMTNYLSRGTVTNEILRQAIHENN